MSWSAAINCNSKTESNRELSYFLLTKDASVHKYLVHAIGRRVDNLFSKIKNLRMFSNSYSQEQTEHVYCHSFEFLHNILG